METLLDRVKNEMRKRGCSNLQVNSKVVAVVLDIVNNTDIQNTELWEAEKEVQRLRSQAAALRTQIEKDKEEAEKDIACAKAAASDEIAVQQATLNTLVKKEVELRDYIDGFNRSLAECETPEARDAMRALQVFMNAVKVNDNEAYIYGVASVLTGKEIGAITGAKRTVIREVRGEKTNAFGIF